MAGDGVIVRFAHMELAEPSIDQGFADCVEAGADEVIAFPYMLSPGRHSTRDIPRMVGGGGGRSTRGSVTGSHRRLASTRCSRRSS